MVTLMFAFDQSYGQGPEQVKLRRQIFKCMSCPVLPPVSKKEFTYLELQL